MRLRALTNMSLRQSPDPDSPLYEEWFDWPEGSEFDPPEHLNIDRGYQRGIMEPVLDSCTARELRAFGDLKGYELPEKGTAAQLIKAIKAAKEGADVEA